MIDRNGFIENGRGNPRTSGTYAKVLGRYVRDEGAIPLMEAVRRMTIAPARRLEARVPAMANKGRIKVGADADIIVFDPARIKATPSVENPAALPSGMDYVIVNGVVVIDKGQHSGAKPGKALRGPGTGRPPSSAGF